jgi:hypothetical protein
MKVKRTMKIDTQFSVIDDVKIEIELTTHELRLAMQEYTEHNRCKPVPKVVHYADMGDITEYHCSGCGAYLGRKGDVRDIVVYCRVCGHMLDRGDLVTEA